MELLRLSRAARRLGVHPVTLRSWADSGKIPVTWVGCERCSFSGDIDAMKVSGVKGLERARLEGLYVRVSGTTGQESSLDAQEAELRATSPRSPAACTGCGPWQRAGGYSPGPVRPRPGVPGDP